MNKKMLDILICPIDRHSPLELVEIRTKGDAVLEGALLCPDCSRFYPIMDGIPIMLPDDLRDKKQDMEFLKGNAANLPDRVTRSGMPWHL